MSVGAYAAVMGSNYNDRPRPPEILVEDDRYAVVRERESHADMMRMERHTAPYRALGEPAGESS